MGGNLEIRAAVEEALLPWFRVHRRRLPWRRRRTPYRVWIAELMLQQTRVDAVVGTYEAWMVQFPTVKALADASSEEVLKAWEGLGYYARARNAHRAARYVVREGGGRFPRTLEGLRALPGVGAYTAAAVGSLALGLDAAVVDGNVIRVLTRLYGYGEDVGRAESRARLQDWAEANLVPGRAGEVNEAMMELGALVCVPRAPRCGECPLCGVCTARREGEPERYPVKVRRGVLPHLEVGAGVVVNRAGLLLVARRPEDAMLGGLWEFPGGRREGEESIAGCIARELREELRIRVRVGPLVAVVSQAFSHFTMEMHAHWARIEAGRPRAVGCSAYQWVRPDALDRLPMPRADVTIRNLVRERRAPGF